MSEAGDQSEPRAAPRVEDIERALVLAREVASATASGGRANLRIEHLRALFTNGSGPASVGRIQAALEAAGLSVDPPLADGPDSVSLRIDKRRATLSDEPPAPRPTGVAAYQAAAGTSKRRPAASGVPLADAQRKAAAEQAEMRTPQSVAALLPALIVPVLAASFLGPLFGAIFAGLVLLTSALLSRPGALADGRLGPIRMPASLARSFLLVSFGVALGALAASVALIAAGGTETEPVDESKPIEQPQQTQPQTTQPQTTSPAPTEDAAAEREARRERRARAERRERRERRERAAEREAAPPSGGGTAPPQGGTATP